MKKKEGCSAPVNSFTLCMIHNVFRCPLNLSANHTILKTVEVAQLQVGNQTNDVKVIVSTVAEAEHLLDFLLSCRESQRSVNVSTTTRLSKFILTY